MAYCKECGAKSDLCECGSRSRSHERQRVRAKGLDSMVVEVNSRLSVGDVVILHGLQEKTLNGQSGTIVKQCEESSRWAVRCGSRMLSVKQEN